MYATLKRLIDLVLAVSMIPIFIVPMLAIAVLVVATSTGPVIHWSRRIGRDNEEFWMPKFRSMRLDAPQVATHQLSEPGSHVTPVGRFIRRASLDELPQLFSILRGDLSFVGPRPALFNQDDLILARTRLGIHRLTPGLTGWAQVNGRDEISILQKVRLDHEYLKARSLRLDAKIMLLTLAKVFRRVDVSH